MRRSSPRSPSDMHNMFGSRENHKDIQMIMTRAKRMEITHRIKSEVVEVGSNQEKGHQIHIGPTSKEGIG